VELNDYKPLQNAGRAYLFTAVIFNQTNKIGTLNSYFRLGLISDIHGTLFRSQMDCFMFRVQDGAHILCISGAPIMLYTCVCLAHLKVYILDEQIIQNKGTIGDSDEVLKVVVSRI